MSKPKMYDIRSLEMIIEEIEVAFPMPDRLDFDTSFEQITRLGISRSAKHEILGVIRERIRKLRAG